VNVGGEDDRAPGLAEGRDQALHVGENRHAALGEARGLFHQEELLHVDHQERCGFLLQLQGMRVVRGDGLEPGLGLGFKIPLGHVGHEAPFLGRDG